MEYTHYFCPHVLQLAVNSPCWLSCLIMEESEPYIPNIARSFGRERAHHDHHDTSFEIFFTVTIHTHDLFLLLVLLQHLPPSSCSRPCLLHAPPKAPPSIRLRRPPPKAHPSSPSKPPCSYGAIALHPHHQGLYRSGPHPSCHLGL